MKVIIFVALIATAFAWTSFAPGEGPFDHLSNEEFAARYLMSPQDAPQEVPPTFDMEEFEGVFGPRSHFDWRNHTTLSHCVGAIRDQGKCGSCWAHATTEMMSDRYCIQHNGTVRVNFAPQYMVDCANKTYEAEGCNGAETQTILRWLPNYGMVNESCYPYYSGNNGTVGQCYENICPSGEYKVLYHADPNSVNLYFNYSNTATAKDIFQNGPIYFSMVVFDDFKAYRGGVYYPISYNVLGTHAIKCLGWGFDEERHAYYWICANSWTTGWGEGGFFRIGFNNFIGYKAGSVRTGRSTTVNPLISF